MKCCEQMDDCFFKRSSAIFIGRNGRFSDKVEFEQSHGFKWGCRPRQYRKNCLEPKVSITKEWGWELEGRARRQYG